MNVLFCDVFRILNNWNMDRSQISGACCGLFYSVNHVEPRDGESGIGREEVNMTTGIRKPAPAANMWGV